MSLLDFWITLPTAPVTPTAPNFGAVVGATSTAVNGRSLVPQMNRSEWANLMQYTLSTPDTNLSGYHLTSAIPVVYEGNNGKGANSNVAFCNVPDNFRANVTQGDLFYLPKGGNGIGINSSAYGNGIPIGETFFVCIYYAGNLLSMTE